MWKALIRLALHFKALRNYLDSVKSELHVYWAKIQAAYLNFLSVKESYLFFYLTREKLASTLENKCFGN